MSVLGLTKLQAVNRMLASVNLNRTTAVDSTGSWPALTYGASEEGTAEYWLDVVSQRIQSQAFNRGLTFNVVFCKKYGTDASPVTSIAFASTVIAVRPAGTNQFDRLDVRDGSAYDLKTDSATLVSGTYFFDVVTLVDFEKCPADVKELICAEATLEYQRRRKGSPQSDQALTQERDGADSVVARAPAAAKALQRGPGAMMMGPAGGAAQPG